MKVDALRDQRRHKIGNFKQFMNIKTVKVGMCGKPKFSSDSVFKNQTIQKFDIHSDGFLIETRKCVQSAIQIKIE